MRDRSRAFHRAALAALLVLLPLSARAEGKVIPLSEESKKDLALFGEGVIGKPLPAGPIEDIVTFTNVHEGTWEYEIVSGKKKGQTSAESYTKNPDGTWKRTLGQDMIEYMQLSDATWSKVAETDLEFDYRANFDPAVHHAVEWNPGDSMVIDSEIKVTKVGDPNDVKYTGHMKSTISYEGVYELTTPAGTFPASLIKGVYDIKVGPADVTDAQYIFYADDVGKVAEIESLSVSALFVYHSKDKTAKVLTKAPGKAK